MNTQAADIIRRYVHFSEVNGFGNEVYCKLHTLIHYGQLVLRFGPLYQFGTFRYERKHQYGKSVARVIRCFINTSKTIHGNHQVLRALKLEESEYCNTNFWILEKNSPQTTMTRLPGNSLGKLNSNDRPFSLGKNIIRKIRGCQDWFLAHDFFQVENDGIYAKGKVLSLEPPSERNRLDLPKLNEKNQLLYISLTNLHHSNDFVFYFNGDCYLLKWI